MVYTKRCQMYSEFVAIDPRAWIFPTAVYLKLIEKFHPNEPVTAHLGKAVKNLLRNRERLFRRASLS